MSDKAGDRINKIFMGPTERNQGQNRNDDRDDVLFRETVDSPGKEHLYGHRNSDLKKMHSQLRGVYLAREATHNSYGFWGRGQKKLV